MLQPTQDSLFKIDGVITDIRMINLHISNYIYKSVDKKEDKVFTNYNLSHMKEHAKRVNQYLKKCFKDALRAKITLTPLAFRFFRAKHKQEGFLRQENSAYGLKFVFTDLDREAHMHLQIYRKMRGGRCSTLALRKLQLSFLIQLAKEFEERVVTVEELEVRGKDILIDVAEIMTGQVCDICCRHLNFNVDYMCYLPPTIRESVEAREGKDTKTAKAFYHENCLSL